MCQHYLKAAAIVRVRVGDVFAWQSCVDICLTLFPHWIKSEERTVHWYERLLFSTWQIAFPDRICCHIRRLLWTVVRSLLALNLSPPQQRSPCLDRAGWQREAGERRKAPLRRRETLNRELCNFTIPCATKIKLFGTKMFFLVKIFQVAWSKVWVWVNKQILFLETFYKRNVWLQESVWRRKATR